MSVDLNFLIKNQEYFEAVVKQDVPDIVEQVIPILSEKIATVSSFVNSRIFATESAFYSNVFIYGLKGRLNLAVGSYVLGKKYKDTPFLAYIKKTINFYTTSTLKEYCGGIDYDRAIFCQNCATKNLKTKTYIVDKFMYCDRCKEDSENVLLPKEERKVATAFAKRTLISTKCCNCTKQIPVSEGDQTTCPFCDKVQIKDAKKNKYYTAKIHKKFTPMLSSQRSPKNNDTFKVIEKGNNNSSVVDELIVGEEFEHRMNSIIETIKFQKVTCNHFRKLPNKYVMYEAIEATLNKFPMEMARYIVEGGKISACSIQALIFQEYVVLMEKRLPILHYYQGDKIEITNMFDPQLNMFDGVRQFHCFADTNNMITRTSYKTVTPEGLIDDNEPHFMAQITSIVNEQGKDMMPYVDNYNFTQIIMGPKYKGNGELLTVTYNSIIPIYAMGPLLCLQRIKKKIMDGVNKRLEK